VALDGGRADRAQLWQLDPGVAFLNHGSFGACPRTVLLAQQAIRDRMEREPVQFFVRDLEALLDSAREALAAFIGADSQGLAFVPNATAGVNAVLRSLRFRSGDELLTTNHAYNACRNGLEFAADQVGARVIVAEVPFPIRTPDEALDHLIAQVSSRTRLALLDHITSPTALIMPIGRIVAALNERGVDALVDGAHAPGMLPLDVRSIRAAYYTGNCHKWICAPKGAGFLYVREDLRSEIHPLSISHGRNAKREDRSRFRLEFDWTGTDDPSAYLCVPEAIRFMGGLLPGGWAELMRHNHDLAIAGRRILCEALEIPPPAPDDMLGSMAALPICDGSPEAPASSLYADPQQVQLFDRFAVEAPFVPWPAPPKRLIRISAQIYNELPHYHRLAVAVREILRQAPAAQ
jgi:isopenicillin-N epimerase